MISIQSNKYYDNYYWEIVKVFDNKFPYHAGGLFMFIQSRLNAAAGRKETAHLLFLQRTIFFRSTQFFSQPGFSLSAFFTIFFHSALISPSTFHLRAFFHSVQFSVLFKSNGNSIFTRPPIWLALKFTQYN